MKQEAKVLLGLGLATVILLVGAVFFLGKNTNSPTTQPAVIADQSKLIKSDSHIEGPASAKLTIVEFGDYQCPACGAAYPILKQLMQEYPDKIRLVFRNFPLPMHANAKIAAKAAEAAGLQNKYWEMHDKLYESQDSWSESQTPDVLLLKFAEDLKLDVNKFKSDLNSPQLDSNISADLSDGNSLGVNSTPTLYFNGEKYQGNLSYLGFKQFAQKSL